MNALTGKRFVMRVAAWLNSVIQQPVSARVDTAAPVKRCESSLYPHDKPWDSKQLTGFLTKKNKVYFQGGMEWVRVGGGGWRDKIRSQGGKNWVSGRVVGRVPTFDPIYMLQMLYPKAVSEYRQCLINSQFAARKEQAINLP